MLMDTSSDERGPSHVGNPDFDHRLNYFYDVFFQHFQHDTGERQDYDRPESVACANVFDCMPTAS